MSVRIIPRLDIKGPNLVKGIHFEGLRVLGKPEDFTRYYYENGADELFYQDVVASLYGRNSLTDIIRKVCEEIYIPITVGGGLRTIDDIREVLRAGADKVAINTAAINDPSIIKKASTYFGSSTIVVSIEAIRQKDGRYLAYTDNGREYTGVDVLSWVTKIQELGAGEIVISSVDKEGTGQGFDYELVKAVSDISEIPVIAHGGAGCVEEVERVITECSVDAVAIASALHYGVAGNGDRDFSNSNEGNFEFLKRGEKFSKIKPFTLQTLKKYLLQNNVECRVPQGLTMEEIYE